MDYDKIMRLAHEVEGNLPNCELEEILYMTKMMCQASAMVEASGDDEASHVIEICDDLCDVMTIEIYRRIYKNEAVVKDCDKLMAIVTGINSLSNKTLNVCQKLYTNISINTKDYDTKDTTKKCCRIIEIEMIKRGLDFDTVLDQKTCWGDVPSPQEIIDGKSPPDIPNN